MDFYKKKKYAEFIEKLKGPRKTIEIDLNK